MRKTIPALVAAIIFTITANAQQPEIFISNGAAVGGYDVVAIYKESKLIKGDSLDSYDWKNAKWMFATRSNLDSFMASPEKYAPQYGGYCAYGLSRGYKAPTEADTWTIIEGKIYFNYNKKVKETWMKNTPAYIREADKNWEIIKLL